MTLSPADARAAELARYQDALERAAQAASRALDQALQVPPRGLSAHEISPDKRFTRVGAGHKALLGYSPSDLVGRHVSDFVVLKETAERAMSRKLAVGAVLLPYTRTFRKADGLEVQLLLLDRHIKDGAGAVVGIRTVFSEAPSTHTTEIGRTLRSE